MPAIAARSDSAVWACTPPSAQVASRQAPAPETGDTRTAGGSVASDRTRETEMTETDATDDTPTVRLRKMPSGMTGSSVRASTNTAAASSRSPAPVSAAVCQETQSNSLPASVTQMMDETQRAMTGIALAATTKTEGIVSELGKLGIMLDLPQTRFAGMGGPLLAASEGETPPSPMIEDANAVMDALMLYKAARDSLSVAPVHMPIAGTFRQSSGYGNRKDPFTGSRAFHSGLDFAAATGTSVLAAADGVVSFVGERSGYGKVVELDHGNGLVTRYAHLSAYIAQTGQRVQTGMPIAKVGSTGRSPGPHLHFEVHRGDNSIDPKPFLETGKRILALLG